MMKTRKLTNYSTEKNKILIKSKRFLLDTQIFIRLMQGNSYLSQDLIKILKDPQNLVFISVASVWEIIIKRMNGKLKVPKNIEKSIRRAGFSILSIDISHVLGVEKLPILHKDPFDRILIAQAKEERCILITNDSKIKRYNINILN